MARVSALSAGTASLRPCSSATPQAPQFLEKRGVLGINPAEYESNNCEITSCCRKCSGCSVCTPKRRSELHCRERAGQKEQMPHCSPIYPWYEHFFAIRTPAGYLSVPCYTGQMIPSGGFVLQSPNHHKFFPGHQKPQPQASTQVSLTLQVGTRLFPTFWECLTHLAGSALQEKHPDLLSDICTGSLRFI